ARTAPSALIREMCHQVPTRIPPHRPCATYPPSRSENRVDTPEGGGAVIQVILAGIYSGATGSSRMTQGAAASGHGMREGKRAERAGSGFTRVSASVLRPDLWEERRHHQAHSQEKEGKPRPVRGDRKHERDREIRLGRGPDQGGDGASAHDGLQQSQD